MKCAWHICTNEAKEKFCGRACKNKYFVDRKRRKLKLDAIQYKGGKCEKCGYDKCPAAFDFHHKDPNEKEFGLAAHGHTKSWDKVKEEIDKCMLLCANCHREVHYELTVALKGELT